jgi:NitT/TauT family transport system permease protein
LTGSPADGWGTWPAAAIALALLVIWEAAVRLGALPAFYFPAPTVIARTLAVQIASGELPAHVGATLSRLLPGLVLGCIPGLILGLVMGWSPRLRTVADPLVAALHPLPKIALLPLVMIFFGIGETSKIVMVAVAAFFPMVINTMAGVRQIPPIHFEVAENYGAGLFKLFTRVTLPGSLPLVLHGLRLALNIGLLLTIASEIAAGNNGLGARIWLAWEVLRVEEVYAILFVISALGFSFTFLIHSLSRRLVPWQVEPMRPLRR